MAESTDPTTRQAEARVGSTLHNKWRLDRLLGVGGMAAVYAATHRNGKRGAVKLLHPDVARDREARERFLREGYVANRIGHPGVVAVLDDDSLEDGTVYLVMELLEGQPVDSLWDAAPGQRVDPRTAVGLVSQLLDVLSAAHAQGVVHRDLKPENLFLTQAGVLKVLDFGIARLRETGSDKRTQTGSVMGTPAFMPPEQALGDWHRVDQRTDLWAAGATLFSLLTGRHVHAADTMNKLLLAAMTQQAPPLATVLPGVHPALAEVVDRALAYDPAHRFQSATDMRLALLALHDEVPATARQAPAPTWAEPASLSQPRQSTPSGTKLLPSAAAPIVTAAATLHAVSHTAPPPSSLLAPNVGVAVESAKAKPRQRRWGYVGGALVLALGVASVALWQRSASTPGASSSQPAASVSADASGPPSAAASSVTATLLTPASAELPAASAATIPSATATASASSGPSKPHVASSVRTAQVAPLKPAATTASPPTATATTPPRTFDGRY